MILTVVPAPGKFDEFRVPVFFVLFRLKETQAPFVSSYFLYF